MNKQRRIVFLTYSGFELMDLSGPMSVFTTANDLLGEQHYEIVTASSRGGQVHCAGGITISSTPLYKITIASTDTVLIVGAQRDRLLAAMSQKSLQLKLHEASKKAKRYGSVCSGAFVLAAAGLLDGKHCATHWAGYEDLTNNYTKTSVDRDALYVNDGRLWTSAGVTTGIDMALSMLAEDHGASIMGKVAKTLVVYAHRPGHQSQFSELLELQTASNGEFAALADWLQNTLDQPLKVSDMAQRMIMSERTFQRKFTLALGTTPAKFLENLRLDHAKQMIEAGQAIKAATISAGYRSQAAFRTAFKTRYGITPSQHAGMFGV